MPDNGTQTLDQLQESVTRARLERQLKQERFTTGILESYWYGYPGARTPQGVIVPPRSSEQDDGDWLTSANVRDRQEGKHYSAFQSEQDLREIWNMARFLADSNVFALGPLRAVSNKVIGTGFRYRAVSKPDRDAPADWVQMVQDENDRFDEVNLWNEMEWEIFRRSRRDGEAPIRHFDGVVLKVRTIEPEQIVQPIGEPSGPEWSFGVHCTPDDEQELLGYWVSYSGSSSEGEEIDAGEIEQFKTDNVDRIVRRGLSDFFCTQGLAEDLRKLMRNLQRGAALLSAIAWIEQYETATKVQVEAFADEVAELRTTNPRTGLAQRYERIEPGTVVRTGKGKSYLPPPLASANVPQFIEIARICRMALASRWNAPESIFGDASNGSYASLAVTESPFVAEAERQQSWYGARFRRIKIRAMENAIREGRLPSDILRAVDILVEPPPIVVRDRLQQAQVNEIHSRAGILSPQTWAQSEDLDFDQEQEEITRAKQAGWTPPQPIDPRMGTPLGTEPADKPDEDSLAGQAVAAGADTANTLRASVGGSQAIAEIQRAYYAGQLPRQAAIANAVVVFGFTDAEAERLFPQTAPTKLTPEETPTTEGRLHPFGLWNKLLK